MLHDDEDNFYYENVYDAQEKLLTFIWSRKPKTIKFKHFAIIFQYIFFLILFNV